jgi:hypothetical protein
MNTLRIATGGLLDTQRTPLGVATDGLLSISSVVVTTPGGGSPFFVRRSVRRKAKEQRYIDLSAESVCGSLAFVDFVVIGCVRSSCILPKSKASSYFSAARCVDVCFSGDSEQSSSFAALAEMQTRDRREDNYRKALLLASLLE